MTKILEDNPIFDEDYRYLPVVGDSVTGDTPLFIKYNETGYIDIKPIEELFNDTESQCDILGREYDASPKKYKVLCRSGWVSPQYVYRHKTNKPIYRVKENDMVLECTEDHSLFNKNKEKIKPSEITETTDLEYYNGNIEGDILNMTEQSVIAFAIALSEGRIDRIPVPILNSTPENKKIFLQNLNIKHKISKTCQAGIQFLLRAE